MVELAAIVLSVALFLFASIYFLYPYLPSPIIFVLGQGCCCGVVVAFASFSKHTTGLLGKSRDGRLGLWSWLLFYPYHMGLRIKLTLGPFFTKEPLHNKVASGW